MDGIKQGYSNFSMLNFEPTLVAIQTTLLTKIFTIPCQNYLHLDEGQEIPGLRDLITEKFQTCLGFYEI